MTAPQALPSSSRRRPSLCRDDEVERKQEWLAYYSRKRIIHQWMQVYLLGMTPSHRVLEVGPALGLVTSLLANIGYEIHTLDNSPRAFAYPDTPHYQRDICEVQADDIRGFDAILCCETLEHVEWERVGPILSQFRASGVRYLVVSVPYMAFQVFFEMYLNSRQFRQYFSMKKLLWRREFVPEPPGGHQWEVGYKGYPLRQWESRLTAIGWSIVQREFTEHCRSVFHLLEAA